MLNRLLPILVVNFVAVNGYAANVCETLPDCQQLKTQLAASLAAVKTRIQELQPSPQFGDIARNINGSTRYMRRAEAIKYCAKKRQHLPSAIELAQLATSMGAAGISGTAKDGYYPVSAKNADGSVDNFYFSYTGYNRPAGDLGNNWFWSSSDDQSVGGNVFVLSGVYGDVGSFKRDFLVHSAVRCARGQ